MADTLEKSCYRTEPNFVALGRLGVIMEILQKILTHGVPPFKVWHRNRHDSTYDFLLVTHNHHGPMSKIANFPHLPCI